MTSSDERFHEQLVDYLYGELEGEGLRAFEASLAASEERRAELTSMRETLRIARTGLPALQEEPPVGVRAAILAAERAARASGEQAAVGPASSAARAGGAAGRVVQGPWRRIAQRLPARVVLPSLAAAAALTFAVLAPRRDHVPGAWDDAVPVPASAPERPPEPAAAKGGEEPGALGYDLHADEMPRGRAERAAVEARRSANEVKPTSVPSGGGGIGDLGSRDEGREVQPQSSAGARPARKARRASEPSEWDPPHTEGSSAPEADRRADDEFAARDRAEPFPASPAKPGAARAGAGAGAVGTRPRETRSAARDDELARGQAGSEAVEEREAPAKKTESASTGAAAAQAPAKSAPATKVESAPAAVAASAPAAPSADGAAKAEAKADTNRTLEAMVARAREHVEHRRWADAIIAYRELLQRFPKDPRAASWRSELSHAARELSAVPVVP